MSTEHLLQQQIAYYRLRAEEYDQWFHREGRYDRGPDHRADWMREVGIVRAEVSRAVHDADVLELACGTGLWTEQLARENRRVLAIDASPEAIAINQARVKSSKVEYEAADIFAWVPPQRFEAVFFAFWLSHVPPDRFDSFWAMLRRAIKQTGHVFFVDSLFEQSSTATDHQPVDRSGVARRKLNDGREFDVVKVFYEPHELEGKLGRAGWDGAVQSSGKFFLWGDVHPYQS
jgi:demethylmenaquinone methyltransferase/2-methoxy-6-polyprenyl-1,4-benzoquinol methylase